MPRSLSGLFPSLPLPALDITLDSPVWLPGKVKQAANKPNHSRAKENPKHSGTVFCKAESRQEEPWKVRQLSVVSGSRDRRNVYSYQFDTIRHHNHNHNKAHLHLLPHRSVVAGNLVIFVAAASSSAVSHYLSAPRLSYSILRLLVIVRQ